MDWAGKLALVGSKLKAQGHKNVWLPKYLQSFSLLPLKIQFLNKKQEFCLKSKLTLKFFEKIVANAETAKAAKEK